MMQLMHGIKDKLIMTASNQNELEFSPAEPVSRTYRTASIGVCAHIADRSTCKRIIAKLPDETLTVTDVES